MLRNRIDLLALSFVLLVTTAAVFSENASSRRLNDPNAIEISSSSTSNKLPFNEETLTGISTYAASASVAVTTPIKDYLATMNGERSEMVLLKWNSSGILENVTDPSFNLHLDWIRPFLDSDFQVTSPSTHGKVALIFVCDVIYYIPWDTIPPIPVLVYTIRKERFGLTNYILTPNPYDQSGYSEFRVTNLFDKFTDSMINTTYDTFHSRHNILIWRGSDHGESIRAALIAQSELESISNNGASSLSDNETSSSPLSSLWLDAKISNGNDAVALTEEELASKYKYHLDVGGVSGTSWEGLRWKMCSGNLVFHIESGAMDWWHNDIEAGVHYLEVLEDLSNLKEQYDWAESHPVESFEIAQRGQQACLHSYRQVYAKQVVQNIIHSLEDATIEQIQEADKLFEEYYTQKNNQEQ
jgi:Glycosyl transferase family 90